MEQDIIKQFADELALLLGGKVETKKSVFHFIKRKNFVGSTFLARVQPGYDEAGDHIALILDDKTPWTQQLMDIVSKNRQKLGRIKVTRAIVY